VSRIIVILLFVCIVSILTQGQTQFRLLGEPESSTCEVIKPEVSELNGNLFTGISVARKNEKCFGDQNKGYTPFLISLQGSLLIDKLANCNALSEQLIVKDNEIKKTMLKMLSDEESRLQEANYWSSVKWISFATGVTCGVAAHLFGKMADQNYEYYQNATTTADALRFKQQTNDNGKFRDILLFIATTTLSMSLIAWILQTTH